MLGFPIDAGIRLGVLLSRLGDDSDSAVHAVHGTESSSSPDTTYADAEVDFDYVTSLVYQHINPAINADTHSHGTDIRGNIKIYYTLILDHGNFVVGTDDQNAGEVPVTATGFTGNLSATDTDVQTALDTIDALSVGGGGAITQATENRAWRGERRDGSPGDCKQRHNDSWVDKQPHTPNSRRRAPSGYCGPSHSSDRYRPIGVDGNTVTRTCNCCTPDDDADGYRQRYDGSQGGYRRVDCCQCRRRRWWWLD